MKNLLIVGGAILLFSSMFGACASLDPKSQARKGYKLFMLRCEKTLDKDRCRKKALASARYAGEDYFEEYWTKNK